LKNLDLAIIIFVITVWGGNFIAMKMGAMEIPPFFLLGMRLLVASLALVWFIKSPRGMLLPLIAISFTMCILHFGLALVGLQHVGAGIGALGMQAAVPFAALLAWLFYREAFGWLRVFGVMVAFFGLKTIYGIPSLAEHTNFFLLMIISSLCFAIATIQIKNLSTKDFLSINAWISIFGTPMAFLVSAIVEDQQLQSLNSAEASVFLSILYMGLVASVFGQGLWYRMLPIYKTNQLMPFTLLVPIIGLALGVLILDEVLTWQLALGGMITVTGVAIIIREPKKNNNLADRRVK